MSNRLSREIPGNPRSSVQFGYFSLADYCSADFKNASFFPPKLFFSLFICLIFFFWASASVFLLWGNKLPLFAGAWTTSRAEATLRWRTRVVLGVGFCTRRHSIFFFIFFRVEKMRRPKAVAYRYEPVNIIWHQ